MDNIDTIIINRRSLRIRENPLYQLSNPTNSIVIFFFDSRNQNFSQHQKLLWFRSVYKHAKTIQKNLLLFLGTPTEFINQLKKLCSNLPKKQKILLDRCDDPHEYGQFEKMLEATFNVEFVTTLTLVDWWLPENTKEISRITAKYNQFNTVKKIISNKLSFLNSREHISHFFTANLVLTNNGWLSFDQCKKFIESLEKEMTRNGKTIFDFPKFSKKTLDTQVQEYMKKTDKMRRTPLWYKPNTRANASLQSTESETLKMSSKMSPLIALGLISVQSLYRYWAEFAQEKLNPKQGSLLAQLIFREMFHAYAVLPCFWEERNVTPCWNSYEMHTVDADEFKKFKNAETGHTDLDTAIKQLKQTGYIHHLQRHIIADFLTLGNLKYDWRLGEAFFKEHLIDHDAASNRGNWLWLSASAFSSKQKAFHYKWDDYIRRNSK